MKHIFMGNINYVEYWVALDSSDGDHKCIYEFKTIPNLDIPYVIFFPYVFKTIINKAVPLLDSSMNSDDSNTSDTWIDSIFEYFNKTDISNPKTYLSSQIPLLGLFDSSILEGNAEGASVGMIETGKVTTTPEKQQPTPTPQVTTTPMPSNIDRSKPAVVIYHTHATESFTQTAQYTYKMTGDFRTTDKNFNNCRVGNEVKNYIEMYYGVAVVHDETLHDYPSYNGSYSNSKSTLEKLVKQYPNAKFYIDLHRDAGLPKAKMVANVNGEQAAKVMLVIGKSNPHWQENYNLALKLNQKLSQLSAGIVKPIDVANGKIYNQAVSKNCILIEIGASCNTLEEVLASARMVGKAIGEMVKGS
jgi:stage II sporulation protein P